MVTNRSSPSFRALADPTRRAILDYLRTGRRTPTEVARRFPVSRPAISRHLRILRQARLIDAEPRGRQRLYRLNPRPLRQVDLWLARYRRFWAASLTSLKDYLEDGRRGGRRSDQTDRHT